MLKLNDFVPSVLCVSFVVPEATDVPVYNWILVSVDVEYTVVPLITALNPPVITHPLAEPAPVIDQDSVD